MYSTAFILRRRPVAASRRLFNALRPVGCRRWVRIPLRCLARGSLTLLDQQALCRPVFREHWSSPVPVDTG